RADHPTLTARRPDGTLHDRQPLPVVMGTGTAPSLPALDGAGEQVRLLTHDPSAALAPRFDRGIRHVRVERRPSSTGAFPPAYLADELIVHLAPTLLGAGRPAVEDLSITTLADRRDLDLAGVTSLPSPGGPTDLRLTLHPRRTA